MEDSANLPEPHVLAEEIADDRRSALEQIESVLAVLQHRAKTSEEVRIGSVIALALHGDVRVMRVTGLPSRRGPAAEARLHYEEIEEA